VSTVFHRRLLATTVALFSLSLVGCSAVSDAGDSPEALPSASPAAPSSTASSEPAMPSASSTPSLSTEQPVTTSRGDLKKDIGERAAVVNHEDGSEWLEFTVEGFEQVTCPDSWSEDLKENPDNYLIAADISVVTTPAMAETELAELNPGLTISFGSDWWGFTSEGERINEIRTSITYNCLDSQDELPWEIGPGEKARGLVLFEVPDLQGELAYRPWYLDGGWSWSYDLSEAADSQ
jgi:hypothetical protein